MTEHLVSVVVPVKNEQDNIGHCLARLRRALADVDHEVIVVYDSPQDPTLPAIERATEKSARLRTIQNTLGKGPSCAIRSGLAAAAGDVAVVTMADLSDPPEVILQMADAVRSGADVVSGSRYMRGGSQSGGPPLKVFLSRFAGLSLAYVAGFTTHDATTSFRAFSRRFLQKVPLTSTVGFTFAIESTVRAHLAGFVVTEVPSTWTDRTAGQSNFRVSAWLGAYLRWYALAMTAPVFAWVLWMAAGAAVLGRGGSNAAAALSCMLAAWLLLLVVRRLRRRMALVDGVVGAGWALPFLVPTREHDISVAAVAAAAVAVVAVAAWVRGSQTRRSRA